ncbi:hypothetical protein BH780_gp225 [Bacillus phage Eldridge]|uniref:Uncharacterized protein n=1 Tax=Bacillus phage Eldridge TaxID=1776293 RepID=A0A0Y0AUX7_9CAUD|nr:hypothetical protein BH780_gp225 [Bacillus phage Eldridge]AMB18808.1 hypothetical protein Eldridge_0228 [Bacillus phage Eldridge]
MLALAILFGLGAVGLYTWGIVKLVGEKKKAGWILAGATAVLLFLFVPTITDIVNDTGERAAEVKTTDNEDDTLAAEDDETEVAPPAEDEAPGSTEGDNSEIIKSVGETKYLSGVGDVTLLNEAYPSDTITMGPLNVKVEAIKVFKVENPDPSFKEHVDYMGEKELGDPGYYLTVTYKAENTTDTDLDWMDLTSLQLSNGQQINGISNDFMPDDMADNDGNSTYYGMTSKEYVDAYVVNDENFSDVKLVFNEVNDNDTFDTLAEETQVTYTFK